MRLEHAVEGRDHRATPSTPFWKTADVVWWSVLAALAVWGVLLAFRGRGFDLHIYLTAADRFIHRADLYPPDEGLLGFKYSPVASLLFLPFLILPKTLATVAWNVLSIALLAASTSTIRSLASRWFPDQDTPSITTAIIATVALGQSIFLELFYGQVDLLLLWLLLASASLSERNRHWKAGAAVTLAICFKPPMAVFGLHLLLRKKYRTLISAGFLIPLFVAPIVAWYGLPSSLELLESWAQALTRTTAPWILGHNSQGLPTMLLSLVHSPGDLPEQSWITGAQLLSIAMFVALVLGTRPNAATMLATACWGTVALSPLAWRANHILCWPLVFLALSLPGPLLTLRRVLVGTAAFVNLGVSSDLLGQERFRELMLMRPFGVVFAVLVVVMCVSQRRSLHAPERDIAERTNSMIGDATA